MTGCEITCVTAVELKKQSITAEYNLLLCIKPGTFADEILILYLEFSWKPLYHSSHLA